MNGNNKIWKYEELVFELLKNAKVPYNLQSVLFGLLPFQCSLTDRLPLELISNQLKTCIFQSETFQELIEQSFFLNDIFDTNTPLTPRISPLQIRAFLNQPLPNVPNEFLDILKGFFISKDKIQKGEGFEDFHANWERLIRYSLAKSPNYIYKYFPQVELGNPNRSLVHLTNKLVSETESLVNQSNNMNLNELDLQEYIILPKQGTEGLDILIVDKYKGNPKEKFILIGIEVRYSKSESNNMMYSNEVIDKYLSARKNTMEAVVKKGPFKKLNIQPSDIWYILISFREIEDEREKNFYSILDQKLKTTLNQESKLIQKNNNQEHLVKHTQNEEQDQNKALKKEDEVFIENQPFEQEFAFPDIQGLVDEVQGKEIEEKTEKKEVEREDFEKKYHFIIMTRSIIRNYYNYPLQILSFIYEDS